jgi:DnaK suppressor protein
VEDDMKTQSVPGHVESHRDRGLRQAFERQRHEIRRLMRERIRRASEANSEMAHLDESALSDVVDDLDYALVSLQAETLENIDEALDRLAAGEYGYCEDCGGEIPARRLEALPFAVRCLACEQVQERRHATQPIALTPHRPAFLS